LNKHSKKKIGYEIYGYWMFFTKEGAGKIIGDHVSFVFIFYALIPSAPFNLPPLSGRCKWLVQEFNMN